MSKKEINQVVASSYQLYINGEWTTGSGNKMIASYNPSNGEKLAKCRCGSSCRSSPRSVSDMERC